MKKLLIIIAVLAGLAVVVVVTVALLTPTMDRWGATEDEIAATYPGDELVADPKSFVNHAVTIQASPSRSIPGCCSLGPTRAGCTAIRRSKG